MNPNPDAFSLIYTSSSSILNPPSPEHPPAFSPPHSFRDMLSHCRRFLRSPQPETLVLLPLPCIILILVCLMVLLLDIWREESFINCSLKMGI